MEYPETVFDPCVFATSVNDPLVMVPVTGAPPDEANRLALMSGVPIVNPETAVQPVVPRLVQSGPPE
jgi:hypothetical protein